jgi:hypothetical protein
MTLPAPLPAVANVTVSEQPEPGIPATSARRRRASLRGERGAVFVEFLIVFLPVLALFLGLLQLGLLFAVRLVTEHAAFNAARAAAVIIGDDPKTYNRNASYVHTLNPSKGDPHYDAIRKAAMITLAPYILDGTIHSIDLDFPPPDLPEGRANTRSQRFTAMNMTAVSKVRVRVRVSANCKVSAMACGAFLSWGQILSMLGVGYLTKNIQAEAMYPYQGASYEYP